MNKIELKPGEYTEFPSWQTLRAYVDAQHNTHTWAEVNKERLLSETEHYRIRYLIRMKRSGNWHVSGDVWTTMVTRVEYPGTSRPSSGCECGAKHTSFPSAHMGFCPEYKRITA